MVSFISLDMFKRAHILFTLVAVVAAQLDVPGLSPECSSTLLQVAGNPDASACLNIGGLVAIATAPANTSLVPKADAWVAGVCKVPPCQQATLQGLATNLTAGCSKDLQLTSNVNLGQYINQYYPTIREVLCLKDNGAGGQLCITEDLTAVETAIGQPLSINALLGVVGGTLSLNSTSLPKTVVCSTCSQATYSIFKKEQPDLFANPAIEAEVKKTCGDAFTTGGIPPTIVQGGGATSPTPKNAAAALMPAWPLQWFGFAAASSLAGMMAVLL